MWNGVPALPSVMPSRWRYGMVTAGTNASVRTSRAPVMRLVNIQTWPPTWV